MVRRTLIALMTHSMVRLWVGTVARMQGTRSVKTSNARAKNKIAIRHTRPETPQPEARSRVLFTTSPENVKQTKP